jgi:hypothetical protein
MGMDLNKAIAWVEGRWGSEVPCPMCHGTDWSVNDDLGVIIGSMDADKHVDMTKGIPIVAVWCTTCGFIALVNAVTAGLVQ